MTDTEKMVTLTQSEYNKLFDSYIFLNALEQCGVDNWEGYSIACRLVSGEEDEEENDE